MVYFFVLPAIALTLGLLALLDDVKAAAVIVLVCLAAATANAQATSGPVVTELGKRGHGEFYVTNNGVEPHMVVIEAYSFSLDPATGESKFRPLDSTVDLQLHETSARLGPKETHIFEYDMKCSEMPCLVTLFSCMLTGQTQNGMAVRLMLPSVVYQCEKQKGCRTAARHVAGLAN